MERPSLTSIKNESGNDNSVKSKGKPQNIKVILRARPPLKSEFGKEIAVSCSENKKTVNIDTSTNIVQSTLDGAFDETACQLEIFQQIKSYIPDVIQGYNCTIFAYGQTGSGKTHTMFGADWENIMMRNQGGLVNNIQNTYIGDLDEDKNLSGLIPRTIHELFREIQKEENRAQNFAVYCSFLQIYNEKIFDLLTERSSNTALMIRENKMDGIYVDGLTEYCVSNFDECLLLMQRGEKNRFIRHTSNNVKSSRSHTIFQLTVESTCADASGKLQKAKLNLCDLAGSEKLNKGEDIANAHLKELKNINLSLTTLGKVIHNLSLAQKLPIPYRESKLTRLLQDSLGGNTRTCLIATLAPTLDFVDETLNTLKFAERAKHIVTEVKANKIEAVDAELITKLQKEIHYLKEILNIRRKGTSAINQVNQKLLILQEENARLRQSQFSIPEVEKLLHENRAIKFELQQLRYETNSQSDRFQEGDQNFDATGGLSTYSRKTQMPPLAKSIFEPRVGDILDTVHETEREKASPQRVSSSIQRRKSSKVLDYVLNDTTDTRIKNNSEGPASLRVGKLISVAFSAKNQENSNTSTRVLPLRVKGKSTDNLRKVNKPPQEYKKQIEFKTKEQMKSLRRLQDLDAWQKKLRGQEMGHDTTSKGRFSAAPSMSDITTTGSVQEKSVVVANKYPDFDKLYNPYKVRQEIERKYSSQPRSNLQMRNLKTTEEYSKFRNIEKNFF